MEFIRSLIQASPQPSSGSHLAPAISGRSWGVVARCADVTGGSGWAPLVPASSTPSAHPARRSSHPSPIAANRPYPHRFPAIGSATCSISPVNLPRPPHRDPFQTSGSWIVVFVHPGQTTNRIALSPGKCRQGRSRFIPASSSACQARSRDFPESVSRAPKAAEGTRPTPL